MELTERQVANLLATLTDLYAEMKMPGDYIQETPREIDRRLATEQDGAG